MRISAYNTPPLVHILGHCHSADIRAYVLLCVCCVLIRSVDFTERFRENVIKNFGDNSVPVNWKFGCTEERDRMPERVQLRSNIFQYQFHRRLRLPSSRRRRVTNVSYIELDVVHRPHCRTSDVTYYHQDTAHSCSSISLSVDESESDATRRQQTRRTAGQLFHQADEVDDRFDESELNCRSTEWAFRRSSKFGDLRPRTESNRLYRTPIVLERFRSNQFTSFEFGL